MTATGVTAAPGPDTPGTGDELPRSLRGRLQTVTADLLDDAWARLVRIGTLGPRSRRAQRFAAFGASSAICWPVNALYGERHIALGSGTIIGPHAALSVGTMPDQVLTLPAPDGVGIRIGDRCLIGRGSGVVAHASIEIGDDVFTGHHVYVTDANHGYEDVGTPIGRQFGEPRPVSIGAGSWLGHGSIVLPGARIGRHVVVGAGSVVTGELPDFCVAVGNPARVIRRYDPATGWTDVRPSPTR
jgi:acetyltransferase-like isoleucine patch superfamily enzyme